MISGCHPFVPKCEHGLPVNMECHSCKSMRSNVVKYSLEDFDKRLTELETYIETGMLHNDWRHKILGMEEILESVVNKLERQADAICELQDRVKELEKELEFQMEVFKTNFATIKSIQSKKPHKCPACDGIGLQDISPDFTPPHRCGACEGKSIVWG